MANHPNRGRPARAARALLDAAFAASPADRLAAYRDAQQAERIARAHDAPISRPRISDAPSSPYPDREPWEWSVFPASETREALAIAAGFDDAALLRGSIWLERRNGETSSLARMAAERRAAELGVVVKFT